MADLIGQTVGQYEITALLGEGGMASVYRASQSSIKRDVAIKVIESKLARNPDFVRRFEREAQTVAALNHSHILKVFDYGQQGDLIYLVMELHPGGSLADLLQRGPLPVAQTTRLLDQVASALDYAHRRGVIHRDLKPQNVLLDDNGDAHLSDFGIAKIIGDSTLTQGGMIMGTPSYMSPEQWQGQPLDSRADVYALGVMLFEMVTGQLPFTGETPASLMYQHLEQPPPSLSQFHTTLAPAVDKVIGKALDKDRDNRFSSAGELAAAFKAALAGESPATVAPAKQRTSEPTVRGVPAAPTLVETGAQTDAPAVQRRRPIPLIAGLIGLVVVIALLGGYALLSGKTAQSTPTASLATTTIPSTALVAVQPTSTIAPATAVVAVQPTPTTTLPTSTIPSTAVIAVQPATLSPVTATLPPVTPLAASTMRSDSLQVAQVWVPAGCFLMGSDPTRDQQANDNELPQHEVCLTHGYWLDQTEVTNANYQKFIDDGGYTKQQYWSTDGWQWLQSQHITGPDQSSSTTGPKQPQVGISWYEADAYAKWRGGRLPTEAEWEYAARGPQSFIFPWGDTYDTNKLNADGKSTTVLDVGSFPAGNSWVGAYDMAGSVWEWVNDWIDPAYYKQQVKNDPPGPTSGQVRGVRGGASSDQSGYCRSAFRGIYPPVTRNGSVGFRVITDA